MTNKCENCNASNMCEDVAGSCEKVINYANTIYNKALDDFLNEISESILWGILAKVMPRDINATDETDEVIDYLQKIVRQLKGGKEKTFCNCQHNNNPRDNEPCCRCDSRMTNADRIRNMSDKELAELLTGNLVFNCSDYCNDFAPGCAFKCQEKDREMALRWLQSEAEQERG